jgi:cytochrome c oxidase assembly factor CtaG
LGRGVGFAHAIAFWIAWLVLALTAISPLHWLSERLFTAHMIEHAILMTVVAPLLAIARPLAAIVWSLPAALRTRLNPARSFRPIAASWRFLTAPIVATALQGLALWIWHVPALYALALRDESIHRLQHLSFFVTAVLFWWVLFHGGRHNDDESLRDGANVLYLFATGIISGLLGALMMLSQRVWYPSQTVLSAQWGLSPLEDQQLAGLVMWVPLGMVYAAAALYFASRWIDCKRRTAIWAPARDDPAERVGGTKPASHLGRRSGNMSLVPKG